MAGEFGNPDRKSSLIEPLTTIWTIPGGCPSPVPLVDDNHTTLDSSCYPPDDWTIWESLGFYSPGICPRGYTSGCKVTDSAYGGIVRPTETAAICVPRSVMFLFFINDSGLTVHVAHTRAPTTLSTRAPSLVTTPSQSRHSRSDGPSLTSLPLKPRGQHPAAPLPLRALVRRHILIPQACPLVQLWV